MVFISGSYPEEYVRSQFDETKLKRCWNGGFSRVGSKVYPNVEVKDVLTELTRRVKKRTKKTSIKPVSLWAMVSSVSDPITAEALYPRWANFLKPNDILITETGTSALGLGFALLPKGVTFHNQTAVCTLLSTRMGENERSSSLICLGSGKSFPSIPDHDFVA